MLVTQVINSTIHIVAPDEFITHEMIYPIPYPAPPTPPNQPDGCVTFGPAQTELCFSITFENCHSIFRMVLNNETEILRTETPLSQFKEVFREQENCERPIDDSFPCQLCTKWSHLVLNESLAAGCGELNIKCVTTFGPISLGCFNDTNVIPQCFGRLEFSLSFLREKF